MYRYKHLSSSSLATIFLLALITISAAQQSTDPPKNGFSPDNVPDPCKQTEFIDCSKCPCQELSSEFNAWMLAIAGLSSALSFLFLVFVVLIQQIRQKPGDLILGTIFGQIIFSVTIIIEKIAFPIPHADLVQQSEADGACIAFGLIKTFSAAMLNFYLLAFFAVYVLSKKNYIKTSRFKARYIHIAGVLITGLFSVVLLTWKAIGLNADGTCGMTSGPAILAPTVGYGVLTVFAAYLVYLTRKNLAGRESITEAPADFVKHYLFYLGIMCGLFLAGAVVAVISDIKTSPDEAVDNTMIHIFGFIQFTILNLSSIVLMVARLRDPLISVHIKDYLKEKLCCQTPEVDERKRSYDEEEMCLGTVNDDVHIDMHKRFISNSSLVQGPYGMFQSSSRDSFEQYKKTEMLSSVLASLAYFWKESHQNALLKSIDLKKDRSPRNAFGRKKSSKSFNVRNSTLMRIVPQVIREFDRRDKKLLYGTFTAYLPDLMQEIIDKDDLMLEIKDAWNFIPNYGNILSYGFNVDEYRTMFFLSSNGKYILQEISSQEKRTLLQALPDYVYHIKANPDSLLARIYGMFTFEAEDHISQVHMIVMKNIGEWGWPGIEKLYKLRGSHTNNERKKGEYSPFNEKDFEAYEGKLVLEMPLKDNIMNILNKDVVFLELNNFENYALQVSLVNKEKVSKEMVSSSVIIEVEEHGDVSPDLRLVKNRELLVRDYEEGFDVDSEDLTERTEMKETNIKTYVGIVDFWKESASKRSNLVWKTLRSLRPLKQETVNDAPVRYGKAFLKYVESIVE